VIAKSFERIHRSNLVGMGIVPLCFKTGEDADTLGLTGHERYTIGLPSKISEIRPGQDVTVTTDSGKSFTCTVRFDTEVFLTFLCFFIFIFIYIYIYIYIFFFLRWLRSVLWKRKGLCVLYKNANWKEDSIMFKVGINFSLLIFI
jgi:hypothetical protein